MWLLNPTGVFGGLVLLAPGLYCELAGRMLYDDPERVEWRDGVDTYLRAIDLPYVLLAIAAVGKRRGDDSPD